MKNAKRRVSLLCSLLLSVRFGWAWSQSVEAVRSFNVGVRYFNEQNFNTAVPYFDEAISRDPNFMDALYARGACKYYLKAEHSALSDLNRVLDLQPDHINARSLRGAIHYEADRWDEALVDFNYVLSRRSLDAQSLLGRGVIRLKRQELARAARDFRTFLRVRPEDPLAPDIRKILASIDSTPSPSDEANALPPRGMTRQEVDDLSAKLTANPIADSYQQKVLRGENPSAVGNIESVPTYTAPKRPDAFGVIVPDVR